jgi:hypothetical protein
VEHGTVCGSLILATVVYLRNEPTVPYEMGYRYAPPSSLFFFFCESSFGKGSPLRTFEEPATARSFVDCRRLPY